VSRRGWAVAGALVLIGVAGIPLLVGLAVVALWTAVLLDEALRP
jgi:hypothetical protein